MMYIRFVAGDEVDDNYWATGILCNARVLIEEKLIEEWAAVRVEEIFAWFNDNVPMPPFSEKRQSGEWTHDAISWFKDSAVEPVKLAGDS